MTKQNMENQFEEENFEAMLGNYLNDDNGDFRRRFHCRR